MRSTTEKRVLNRVLMMITKGDLGGAQTHLYDLCRTLKEQLDIQVVIGEYGPLYDNLMQLGITVHIIPALSRSLSLPKDLHAYLALTALIKELKPDLVATHSSKAGILGRCSAKKMDVPCVFTAHGWAFTEGVSPLKRHAYRLAETWAAHWTDRIICVSDYDRDLALKSKVAAGDKLVCIHNGISLDIKAAAAKPGEVIRLIMVARFCEQKDHALLLKALAGIETEKSYILQLVGDGPDLEKYKALAQQLGIAHQVEFSGPCRNVPELLQQADIFVLSSRWEGFPITILEAMRAGLPVISTDVGGCREAVLEGETGYLVPRGNLAMMQKRLMDLIEDESLRKQMGAAGQIRFKEHFTADKMVEKTLAVYQDVINNHV